MSNCLGRREGKGGKQIQDRQIRDRSAAVILDRHGKTAVTITAAYGSRLFSSTMWGVMQAALRSFSAKPLPEREVQCL